MNRKLKIVAIVIAVVIVIVIAIPFFIDANSFRPRSRRTLRPRWDGRSRWETFALLALRAAWQPIDIFHRGRSRVQPRLRLCRRSRSKSA